MITLITENGSLDYKSFVMRLEVPKTFFSVIILIVACSFIIHAYYNYNRDIVNYHKV